MAKKNLLLIILTVFIFITCKTVRKDDGKTFNKTFVVGEIPDLNAFNTYNELEKGTDSIFSGTDKEFKEDAGANKFITDFRNNRSRVFMDSDSNHRIYDGEKSLTTGMPMPCNCSTTNDSLFVQMVIGFFGGAGFEIALHKDTFLSDFFMYTDDVKPYKSNLQDTAFSSHAIAFSKYQYLLLDKLPTYKPDQQLTGYLTYTSNRFYERSGDTLDSTYVTGKIYFTCNVKERKGKTRKL
ncbi:MAG: hypothetical protein ABI480_06130 [Chitinophagaceae bacterium]